MRVDSSSTRDRPRNRLSWTLTDAVTHSRGRGGTESKEGQSRGQRAEVSGPCATCFPSDGEGGQIDTISYTDGWADDYCVVSSHIP